MKDKDGLYDDTPSEQYGSLKEWAKQKEGKPYKATIKFHPLQDKVRILPTDNSMEERYKFYDDDGRINYLDPGKMEWAPAYVANPMKNKYFIDGVEVSEWEVAKNMAGVRLINRSTVNQTNHPTFQEFHYETYPEYTEKMWDDKKRKYEEFEKATSDPQYWWRYTQQSPYDQQKSDNDYLNHQKSTWGEEIERKARAKAEEELMTAKAKLQKQNLELMLISEKFAKLENENVELRKKVELFENNPDEYLRRKNADPYGEENWDK